MQLEKKQQEELQRRKGLTGRTLIQVIWLLISGVIAFFLLRYLEAQDVFTYDKIYRQLALPRSIPNWAVMGGMILLIVFVMQIAVMFGFMIASPEGRRKTGKPSLHSRNKDPFDSQYH